jgi:murein DD-endopeptidase MepM/ murein hydrolase activator NlpD
MRPAAALIASLAFALWTGGPAWASHPPRSAEEDGLGLPLPGREPITSPFGWRLHPILHRPEFHKGVDFAAPAGTAVEASEDGTVELVGWRGNYGRYVRLRHPGGLETGYAHLARIRPGLHVGSRVRKGEVIGAVGASGLATGPHLFYEVFDHGHRVDPRSAGLPVGDDRSRETLASVREAAERRSGHRHPGTVAARRSVHRKAGHREGEYQIAALAPAREGSRHERGARVAGGHRR